MKIQLKEITVAELTKDYENNAEKGVIGFSGKLDIRPPYQREFIYKDEQRDAVIDTINKRFSTECDVLGSSRSDGGNFEIIDGQQRTISVCQYVKNDFSLKVGNIPESRGFDNLQDNEQQQILRL